MSTTNAWVWAILTLGYLLPWAVAASRGKRNSGGIFWLNLLAGWTVVGWVAALIMAAGTHQAVPTAVAVPTFVVAAPPAPTPTTAAASAPCDACRYPLWYVPGQGWIHQTTRSVWCDPAMTRQAHPTLT